jgi:transposase
VIALRTQAREKGAEADHYHPSFQQIAFLMEETGEYSERRLNHSDGEAEQFYRDLQLRGVHVRVGMEATGYSRWFERLLAELGFEVWIDDPAEIKAKRVKKQKTDRKDAQLLLKRMLEDRFPRIWVPSPENRDVRQLLWHRHRLVQMRTRIMNLLQALAMNEGRRWKSKLWSDQGRAELEKLALAPWASRRRHELLELLDRMNPTIEEFPSLGISLAVVVGFSRHSGSRASLTGKLGAVCLGH